MKDIIDVLVNEHEKITETINSLEKDCIVFMNTGSIDFGKFRLYIKFIRQYADGTHHKKEEDILFKIMLERLGKIAENLVKNGMLVEHDLARLHVMELENALNRYEEDKNDIDKLAIIANAMGYVYLLRRHIKKENEVVYPYAQKQFSDDLMNEISEEAEKYDKNIEVDDEILLVSKM